MKVGGGMLLATAPIECFATLKPARNLTFFHTHTGEHFNLNYSCDGCSNFSQAKLDHFLRDFRTGEVHTIDQSLLDIIYTIQQKTGSRGIIEIISGYRSPKTNQSLQSKSKGVASKSLHMKGQALDIRISDLNTKKLRNAALSLKRGGVGYYPKSNFVHIDTGRFRTW